MMKLTHVAMGAFLAAYFGLDPIMVISGSIFPDIDTIFKHRKLLHNIFILAAAFWYNYAFGIGVLSHYLLDMLTVMGVALFWPLSNKHYRILRLKTGGVIDYLLAAVLALANEYYLFFM